MQEVEFIINSEKLEQLKRILDAHGKTGATFSFVMGYGHQRGLHQVYRREEAPGINLLPKVSVRTVVRDVAKAVRIRTNERGDEAL